MSRITPDTYADFARSPDRYHQEAAFLACCISRSIKAEQVCRYINSLLDRAVGSGLSPMRLIHDQGYEQVRVDLIASGMGKHGQLASTLKAASEAWRNRRFDESMTHQALLEIIGVGQKIASMILSVFLDRKVATLDVHLLRWVREDCGYDTAPTSTPSDPDEYAFWQHVVIEELKERYPDMSLSQADLHVWTMMRNRK